MTMSTGARQAEIWDDHRGDLVDGSGLLVGVRTPLDELMEDEITSGVDVAGLNERAREEREAREMRARKHYVGAFVRSITFRASTLHEVMSHLCSAMLLGYPDIMREQFRIKDNADLGRALGELRATIDERVQHFAARLSQGRNGAGKLVAVNARSETTKQKCAESASGNKNRRMGTRRKRATAMVEGLGNQ